MRNPKSISITIASVIGFIIVLFIITGSVYQIDAGAVGVKLRNGAIVSVETEGLHFKIPFFESIVKFEARTLKNQVVADSASKDLQQITATVALNYRIDASKATEIYKDLGTQYEERVVTPRLQESVKTVTARFTAEELITKRPQVRTEIIQEITTKLQNENILVEDLSIVNLAFSPEFTQAIEQKQLAAQKTLTAQNDLERIKIEAEQKITQARGDAEAQRLQQSTLNELLLQKQFIEKWDGKLPVYFGAQNGILNLGTYTQK